MSLYHWIISGSFVFFIVCFIFILIKSLTKNQFFNPSIAKGKENPAIAYSFTKAMSPFKKESAYLHLPTYTAGMIFHLGTFFCFLCLAVFFVNFSLPDWFRYLASAFVITAAASGTGLLIKRMVNVKLRSFSNPDDYFSNILVIGFQILTVLAFFRQDIVPVLFIYSSVMFLYIPVGKLKHTFYFFTDRIHLGKYYGKRGVWPVNKQIHVE